LKIFEASLGDLKGTRFRETPKKKFRKLMTLEMSFVKLKAQNMLDL